MHRVSLGSLASISLRSQKRPSRWAACSNRDLVAVPRFDRRESFSGRGSCESGGSCSRCGWRPAAAPAEPCCDEGRLLAVGASRLTPQLAVSRLKPWRLGRDRPQRPPGAPSATISVSTALAGSAACYRRTGAPAGRRSHWRPSCSSRPMSGPTINPVLVVAFEVH